MTRRVLDAVGLGWAVQGRAVLDAVDLWVEPGTIVGLLGPNGAGKSTAFRLMAGDLRGPGRVVLRGRDVSGLDLAGRARAGLGYLPQQRCSFRGVTAVQHLAMLAEIHGIGRARQAGCTADALAAVGLVARDDVPVASLSGGERRRLELAGLLLGDFPMMVLDEPFAGVEPGGIAVMALALRAACARGAGVILADHARQTLSVCDEAVLIVDGTVRRRAASAVLREDTLVQEAYLGAASDSDAKAEPRI